MKAILEFNLPEEANEHRLAINGLAWYCVVYDMEQKLRAWLKYGHEFKTADEAIEAMRDELNSFQRDRNVNTDDVE
jgi:hypothetical protein